MYGSAGLLSVCNRRCFAWCSKEEKRAVVAIYLVKTYRDDFPRPISGKILLCKLSLLHNVTPQFCPPPFSLFIYSVPPLSLFLSLFQPTLAPSFWPGHPRGHPCREISIGLGSSEMQSSLKQLQCLRVFMKCNAESKWDSILEKKSKKYSHDSGFNQATWKFRQR